MNQSSPDGRAPSAPARRSTRQHRSVAAYLEKQSSFVSAQQIHAELKAQGEAIGLATVYRVVQRMVQDGELDTVLSADAEALYRRCGGTHHHHLVCRACSATVEIVADNIEQMIDDIAARYGYRDPGHTVELTGVCPSCH